MLGRGSLMDGCAVSSLLVLAFLLIFVLLDGRLGHELLKHEIVALFFGGALGLFTRPLADTKEHRDPGANAP